MSSPYSLTLLPSTAITATINSSDVTSAPALKYAQVCINISAFTSGSITPHIQGYDPASGNYYDILVGSALSATGLTVLSVGPGIATTANVSSPNFLPSDWRVQLIAASGTVLTASVGVNQGV